MAEPSAYEKLKKRFADITNLSGAGGILTKDAQTFMPPGSEIDRSRQLQAIAAANHFWITDPAVKTWLDNAEAEQAALPPADQRNLFLMRRQWVESNSISSELAEELARISLEGEAMHTRLKPTGDWPAMKDWYTHCFETAKLVAEAKMAAMPEQFVSRYEALLDTYSPGMREAIIEREFGKIERALPALIAAAKDRQKTLPDPIPLKGPFPAEQQAELYRRLLKALNFDTNRGRFDMCAAHPSMGGTPDDIRISAQPSDDILDTIYTLIHEAGHGLYEQNTPVDWRYQPAGAVNGLSLHESQSRIMEVQAGHMPEFFQYLERTLRDVFNRPDDRALAAANLERLVNTARPSLIRIEADEVTYAAHVVLRYRLERAIVNGDLSVDDLPQAWNDGMRELLGVTPSNPSEGHMQDVHWPCGLIGYFPAYTLGDIGAAQFIAAASKDKPDLRAELAQGDFSPLNDWLSEHVRGQGSLCTPSELFIAATGEDLNAHYLLDHLSRRYLGYPYQSQPSAPILRTPFAPA